MPLRAGSCSCQPCLAVLELLWETRCSSPRSRAGLIPSAVFPSFDNTSPPVQQAVPSRGYMSPAEPPSTRGSSAGANSYLKPNPWQLKGPVWSEHHSNPPLRGLAPSTRGGEAARGARCRARARREPCRDAEGIRLWGPSPGPSPCRHGGTRFAARSWFCRAPHQPSTTQEGERGKPQPWPAPKLPTGPAAARRAGRVQPRAQGAFAPWPFSQSEHSKLAKAGENSCQELILSHSPLEGLSGQERNLEQGRGGRGVGTQTRQGYFPCAAEKRGRKDTQIDIIEAKCLRFLNQHAPRRAQSKAL